MLGAARWPTSDRVQVPSGKRTDSSILEENRSSAAWSVVISTPQNRSLKRRRITLALLICAALLLVYGASPYFSFWRFTVALRSGDSAAVTARVDFPAIRASLKKQLVARFARATSSHKRWSKLGPTLIDAVVDAYATPDGLAVLISNPGALKDLRAPQQFPTGKAVNWPKVKYAFFTGPRTFVVDREGIKLRFRFEGLRWRLNELDLGLAGTTS
ncbi:MAG: hypothetical protein DME96_10070 [Verrucomicrobia bacterium]|nr:MAG: hypothetical protein DME96_10070 [Verrucomicrobiota bacterium]